MEAVYLATIQYGSIDQISLDRLQLCVCSYSNGVRTPLHLMRLR